MCRTVVIISSGSSEIGSANASLRRKTMKPYKRPASDNVLVAAAIPAANGSVGGDADALFN
jgi:hypothetical protein